MPLRPSLNSFGDIPRSGIVGSYGKPMFNFLMDYHAIFHSSYTILHFHEQGTRAPVSPHPCQLLLFCYFGFFLNNSHSNRHKVVSRCGFDLHLPDDWWCRASLFMCFWPFVYLLWKCLHKSTHLLFF